MANGTRERMLAATARLVQARGYHGTSLQDVLQESRGPRGSLYFHFPGGKEELVLEALRVLVEETNAILREAFAEGRDAGEGVERFFEAVAAWLEATAFTQGCPVASVVADAPPTPALDRLCRDALATWERLLAEGLAAGGVPAARARALATTVLAAEEGAVLLARAGRDAAPVRTAGREMAALARGATPPQPPPRRPPRTRSTRR